MKSFEKIAHISTKAGERFLVPVWGIPPPPGLSQKRILWRQFCMHLSECSNQSIYATGPILAELSGDYGTVQILQRTLSLYFSAFQTTAN